MNKNHIILLLILTFGLKSCDNLTQKEFFDKIVFDEYHSNYNGIITAKYIDKNNRGRPMIVIEEKIFGKKYKDLVFQSSDFFDFMKVGDTITKKNKSLLVNLKRKNLDTIIKLDFGDWKGHKFYFENQYLSQD